MPGCDAIRARLLALQFSYFVLFCQWLLLLPSLTVLAVRADDNGITQGITGAVMKRQHLCTTALTVECGV